MYVCMYVCIYIYIYMKRSLGYSGAILWNGLPSELCETLSPESFKNGLNGLLSSKGTHTINT